MNVRTMLGTAAAALAATACGSSQDAPDEHGSTVGATKVASRDYGDRVESMLESEKTDDTLLVVFERSTNSARLVPRFGAAKTVSVTRIPADAAAATQYVTAPLEHGQRTASAAGGGARPARFDPPPPVCLNPCHDACDGRFPDAAQNAACRFGCGEGCSQ